MTRNACLFAALAVALALGLAACGGRKSEDEGPAPAAQGKQEGDWRARARQACQRGAAVLEAGAKDGVWSFAPGAEPNVGITGLAVLGILKGGGAEALPKVQKSLDWIAAQQAADGSITRGPVATYSTAIALLALKESGLEKYQPVLVKGREYLRRAQFDQEEGYEESADFYGGIGYEKEGEETVEANPNLSTTAWAVEAAAAAGLPRTDDFYKKALVFLQRSQNRSESNDRVHDQEGMRVEPGNDGGAFYQPWSSKAGVEELPDGRHIFRSYGSMSYALLKSYIFCDVDTRDPRVRSVMKWLEDHWTAEKNPGLEKKGVKGSGYRGLFYYWVTLGRTLSAAERHHVSFAGTPLANWREEVARAIMAWQHPDGSWSNDRNQDWWEGSSTLATAYALVVLGDCASGA